MIHRKQWLQDKFGQFVLHQLTHTSITLAMLATLFLGAVQVGALDGLLAPLSQTAGTSFTSINFQGRLANNAGDSVSDILTFRFSIYDAAEGGNLMWGPEIHPDVPISDGLFSVRLGEYETLPPSLLNGGDLWLEIVVKGETLNPREKLTAVPYAMVAGEALTVPDGTISAEKLTPDLALQGDLTVDQGTLRVTQRIDFEDAQTSSVHGTLEHEGINGSDAMLLIPTYFGTETSDLRLYILDNGSDRFSIWGESCVGGDCGDLNSAMESHRFQANGDVWHRGNVSQGAVVENNLQTPEELRAERIARFSEGDVLCWGEGQLELCSQQGDPLVQAVADANGKPIVMGAETIKVLGPVQPGDLLTASEVPGYAVAVDNPASGAVIAQALERCDQAQGLIKAMIRKF